MELFSIDLERKPYGFVKHCKINDPPHLDTYWERTLIKKGLVYHFGGIFVADLNEFRNQNAYASHIRT